MCIASAPSQPINQAALDSTGPAASSPTRQARAGKAQRKQFLDTVLTSPMFSAGGFDGGVVKEKLGA